GLLQGHAITEAEGETLYLQIGRPPDLAKKIAAFFYGSATGGSTPLADKARTQFWNTVHRSYIAGETDENEARNDLAQLTTTPGEIDDVIRFWNFERDTTRKQLTPAQIKKAWQKAVRNPATAQPWTKQDAIDALISRGYLFNDAETFLDT